MAGDPGLKGVVLFPPLPSAAPITFLTLAVDTGNASK
jgi:hypothetical protein